MSSSSTSSSTTSHEPQSVKEELASGDERDHGIVDPNLAQEMEVNTAEAGNAPVPHIRRPVHGP